MKIVQEKVQGLGFGPSKLSYDHVSKIKENMNDLVMKILFGTSCKET